MHLPQADAPAGLAWINRLTELNCLHCSICCVCVDAIRSMFVDFTPTKTCTKREPLGGRRRGWRATRQRVCDGTGCSSALIQSERYYPRTTDRKGRRKREEKTLVYLSIGASGEMSVPIQISTGVPISVVIHFSLSSAALVSPILIHFLQSDAELGQGSNHLKHAERSVCQNALWHRDAPKHRSARAVCLSHKQHLHVRRATTHTR